MLITSTFGMIVSEYALHGIKEVGSIRSKYDWKRFVDPPAGLIDLHSIIIDSHSATSVKMGLEVAESLPAGSGEDWLGWRARTGVGRAKTVMRRWGCLDDAQSVDCDCVEPQTMAHTLSCRLLDEACTADDLVTVTERAKACARKWEKIV